MQPVPEPAGPIERARNGDHDALEALLRDHASSVAQRLTISKKWSHLLEIEDVMQVTYLEVFDGGFSGFAGDSPAQFRAWLESIAQNNLRDTIRGLEAKKRPPPSKNAGLETLLQITGGETSPSGRAQRSDALRLLEAAVDELPAPLRQVIQELFFDARSASDVASEGGWTVGRVYALRQQALKSLQRRLGGASGFF